MTTAEDSVRKVKLEITFTHKCGDQIHGANGKSALVFKGILNRMIPVALKRYPNPGTEAGKHFKELEKDLDVLASPDNRHPHSSAITGLPKMKTSGT